MCRGIRKYGKKKNIGFPIKGCTHENHLERHPLKSHGWSFTTNDAYVQHKTARCMREDTEAQQLTWSFGSGLRV